MWSDRFSYYNIRSDANYSQSLPTIDVVKVLEATSVLKRKGPQEFVNNEDFPWVSLTCVNCNNGNFAHNEGDKSNLTSLITVVASKQNPLDENRYVELLRCIAIALNWELILEEDDSGNEEVVLT